MEFDVKQQITIRIEDKIAKLQQLKAIINIDQRLTKASLERYHKMLGDILK